MDINLARNQKFTGDKNRVILSKALILQDESFGKNYLSFLDFTRNYERTSGIFVPWLIMFIVSNQKEESKSIQRVKACCLIHVTFKW